MGKTILPILLLLMVSAALLAACSENDPRGRADAQDARDAPADRAADGDAPYEPSLCIPLHERCEGSRHMVCSADGSRWDEAPCPAVESCDAGTGLCLCASGTTSVSGVVRFPNGTDPVAGAMVYVPKGSVPALPAGPECVVCKDPASLVAHTTTDVNGAFLLEKVPSGARTIVVEKGYFRRVAAMTVEACRENELDSELTRLPRNAAEGSLPKMAVVKGEWDKLEDVLRRIGIDEGEFDVMDSDTCRVWPECDSGDLMTDLANLVRYHLVFVNCGPANEDLLRADHSRARVRENLLAYTKKGGRVYVTDEAYDFIEQSFPGFVDFAGCGDDGEAAPEDVDCAQCGEAVTGGIQASVLDEDLAAWLAVLGFGDGVHINLLGFLKGWAMIDHAPDDATLTRIDERLKTWVEGDVPAGAGCVAGNRPLMLTVDVECGKVLFSSFHTVHGGSENTVQEKILEYLVFEMAGCFESVIPI